MSDFSDILVPAAVRADVAVGNKKTLFQQLGALVAPLLGTSEREVADRLGQRERLGSTGFGGGVAIPHARIDGLSGVAGAFVRLAQPIDWQAVDDLPVDIVFLLLSPSDAGSDHLKALASVSRRLRDRAFVEKLRGAGSSDALFALLAGVEARDAA